MSDIKLVYFNLRALGEPARLILHHAKADFKDERVQMEEWEALKPSKRGELRAETMKNFSYQNR